MKPIVINITNLIGTVVVSTDKDLEKIEKVALETLHKVVATAHNLENSESYQDKTLLQSKGSENQDQDSQ